MHREKRMVSVKGVDSIFELHPKNQGKSEVKSVEKGWLAEEIWECQQNASDWGDLSQPGQLWSYLFRAQKHLCMSLHVDSLAQLFSSSPAPCIASSCL